MSPTSSPTLSEAGTVAPHAARGRVALVGAGPGDPELLTLKAARLLSQADVVVVDELVNPAILAHAARARVVRAGKRGGCRSTPQAFIERLMIRCARRGLAVVRLKGGDPFVFGRGGEELLALRAAGIAVEVVSGISAGIAAPAALGIPVTHRETARGVTFLTGHTADGAEPDWAALVAGGTTLVVYMGVSRLESIFAGLAAGGLPAHTPVAFIESGTLPAQRALCCRAGEAPARAREAGIASPSIIVIGAVAALATQAGNANAGEESAHWAKLQVA